MNQKTFLTVAGVVFGVVAIAHALRFLSAWPVSVGSFSLPVWASGLGALFAAYLSYQAFRLRK